MLYFYRDVPALKVLAETMIAKAQCQIEAYLDLNAIDSCGVALKHLVTAVKEAARQNRQISSLWKLISDSCMLVHQLPDGASSLQIPDELLSVAGNSLLGVALQALIRALQLDPENGSLWHDLASCYHAMMKGGGADGSTVEAKCMSAIKKAISLEPSNHGHWNAMGVFAMSMSQEDFALAQHCFSKSVQIENNASAWTNLGVLYYTLG